MATVPDLSTIRFAGDILINSATVYGTKGTSIDVRNLILQLQIFEDMFAPFMTGNLTLKDSVDLTNLFPLIGEETLELDIQTPSFNAPDQKISQTFYIYKITERSEITDTAMGYVLHFTSEEAIIDVNTRLSQAQKGNAAEIVQKLVGPTGLQSSKQLAINEPSDNILHYICNSWNPTKAINYCGKMSHTKGRSDYIFFENRNGFNFVSLGTLYAGQAVSMTFSSKKKQREQSAGGPSFKNIALDYERMIEYSNDKPFDYLERISGGSIASRLTTHDYVTKKYSSRVYNAVVEHPNNPHLNPFPPFSTRILNNTSSVHFVEPKHYGIFDGVGDISNTAFRQQRTSLLQLASATKLDIVVNGRTDYTVGQKVALQIPARKPVDRSTPDEPDKIYTGNYLISAINHVITPALHECHMELIKDSFVADVDTLE